MKYVKIDGVTGVVSWDEYFEYLRLAERQFPTALYRYAADWDHYSLDGVNSLHDGWLIGVQFSYNDPQQVTLEFLGARHDRRHVLRYEGVKSYLFDMSVRYRHGDRDLLAHEFRIDDGVLTHELLFRNDRRIVIESDAIFSQVGLQIDRPIHP